VPHSAQAEWKVLPDRADPVEILIGQGKSRIAELLPIRYARMKANPFAFLRGAAAVMAAQAAAGRGASWWRRRLPWRWSSTPSVCCRKLVWNSYVPLVVTGPSWTQVKEIVWGEIHKAAANSIFPFPAANQTELRLANGSYAIGLSTNEARAFMASTS